MTAAKQIIFDTDSHPTKILHSSGTPFDGQPYLLRHKHTNEWAEGRWEPSSGSGEDADGFIWIILDDVQQWEWDEASHWAELPVILECGQMSDKEMLDWLDVQAKRSPTGISFDYTPDGFRFMRRHWIGEPRRSIREAIIREAVNTVFFK